MSLSLQWTFYGVFENLSGHTYGSLFASVSVAGLCLGLSEVVLQLLSALQIGARLHRLHASVCVEAVGVQRCHHVFCLYSQLGFLSKGSIFTAHFCSVVE